jgi:hypothetical protein
MSHTCLRETSIQSPCSLPQFQIHAHLAIGTRKSTSLLGVIYPGPLRVSRCNTPKPNRIGATIPGVSNDKGCPAHLHPAQALRLGDIATLSPVHNTIKDRLRCKITCPAYYNQKRVEVPSLQSSISCQLLGHLFRNPPLFRDKPSERSLHFPMPEPLNIATIWKDMGDKAFCGKIPLASRPYKSGSISPYPSRLAGGRYQHMRKVRQFQSRKKSSCMICISAKNIRVHESNGRDLEV